MSADVELQPAEDERVEAVVATESGGPVETANADKDEPQPASEVAEVTETREQVVAAVTGAELAESAGQPGAEVSEEQLAGEQMADSEAADNEELVEAAMTAEGDQQPEAEAAEAEQRANAGQQANAEPKLDAEHAGEAEDSTGSDQCRTSRRGNGCGRLGPLPRQISASAWCFGAWLRGERTGLDGPWLQP